MQGRTFPAGRVCIRFRPPDTDCASVNQLGKPVGLLYAGINLAQFLREVICCFLNLGHVDGRTEPDLAACPDHLGDCCFRREVSPGGLALAQDITFRQRVRQGAFPKGRAAVGSVDATDQHLELQGEAIGNVNASIADRYYAAASATPASVFGTLLRKAQNHLGKMKGPYYVQKIQDVMKLLNPRENVFPSTLTLAEQGLFALGYYQQRADLWAKRDPAKTEDAEPVEAA